MNGWFHVGSDCVKLSALYVAGDGSLVLLQYHPYRCIISPSHTHQLSSIGGHSLEVCNLSTRIKEVSKTYNTNQRLPIAVLLSAVCQVTPLASFVACFLPSSWVMRTDTKPCQELFIVSRMTRALLQVLLATRTRRVCDKKI
jgi:hypothetical protein